jgi:hypothetical protein
MMLSQTLNLGSPVNASHPLNRGLVGWWLALPNRYRGSRWFDLCNRNPGTLTNMDPATDWVPGAGPGGWGALDFDGGNDLVNLGSAASLDNVRPVSWSLWVNPRTKANNDVLIAKGNFAGGVRGYELRFSGVSGVSIQFIVDGSGGDPQATWSSSGIPVDTWTHLVFTWDGTNAASTGMSLYVNGALLTASSTTDGGNVQSDAALDMILGNNNGAASALDGRMDDARMWNRVLSASEATFVYRDSLAGYGATLNWIRPAYLFEAAAPPAGGDPVIFSHHYRQMAAAG